MLRCENQIGQNKFSGHVTFHPSPTRMVRMGSVDLEVFHLIIQCYKIFRIFLFLLGNFYRPEQKHISFLAKERGFLATNFRNK